MDSILYQNIYLLRHADFRENIFVHLFPGNGTDFPYNSFVCKF